MREMYYKQIPLVYSWFSTFFFAHTRNLLILAHAISKNHFDYRFMTSL